MALSVPSFRQDKLPCWVIDVDATLSSKGRFIFCQADSLSDFCVISHRWTDHVTKLMEEIKSTAKDSELSYIQAVTEKNWADLGATREAYQSIKNFLEVLQAQGVNKVWMDMLCIDQSEHSMEKSREILLMGPYYRYSSACYVPIKGFGFDYKLRMGEPITKYMSWLNRVWTLQEFLLPEKLYFLIELEEWMEEWLARRVAGEDLSHVCSCCFSDEVIYTLQQLKGFASQVEKIREPDIDQSCDHCGSRPLLRKANKAQDCRLYLIQRDALFEVPQERINQSFEKYVENRSFYQRADFLWKTMRERSKGVWLDTSSILSELSNRKCSEEPDIVWGVLGLLGVNSDTNNLDSIAKTAKTAEDQLVELASTGAFTEQLLVLLCGMDPHSGRFKPQMSWIPNLTCRPACKDYLVSLPRNFQSLAANVRVSVEGPITLTVKVLKGYVTYEESLPTDSTVFKAASSRRKYGLRFKHVAFFQAYEEKYTYCLNENYKEPYNEYATFVLPLNDLTWSKLYGFEMWLLYLGHDCDCDWNSHVLLCLHKHGTPGNVVHKIGTLRGYKIDGVLEDPPEEPTRKVLDDLEDPPEEITIAGYGKYLDECVDKI